jgi:hypothetical protein
LTIVVVAQAIAGSAAAQDLAHKNCQCRANDRKYEQGEVLCLNGRLARCEMNLNNPSWKIIAQSCPETNLKFSPIAVAFYQTKRLH